MSSSYIHIFTNDKISFFLKDEKYLIMDVLEGINYNSFISSFVVGKLVCFKLLTVINSTAMNVGC